MNKHILKFLFLLLLSCFSLFAISCVNDNSSSKESLLESGSEESFIQSQESCSSQEAPYELLYNMISVEGVDQYEVVGIEASERSDVEIPSSYQGLPVTKIAREAFKSTLSNTCHFIVSIKIPSSVKNIEWGAFSNCENLERVICGDGITELSNYIFNGCESLAYVEIGKNTTYIEINVLNTVNLKNIVIHEENPSYKSIDGNLYSKDGKTLLCYAKGKEDSQFIIPEDVTAIGLRAFLKCDSLKKIIIGKNVAEIDEFAFLECYNLEGFEVEYSNSCYKEIDGNLYTKDGTELIQCAVGDKAETFDVPKTLTDVKSNALVGYRSIKNINVVDLEAWCNLAGHYSFSHYTASQRNFYINGELVSEIVVPDTVTTLKRFTFSGFENIQVINVGDGVTQLEYSSISACKNLKEIVFGKSVKVLQDGSYISCTGLEKITVDEENPSYKSINGVLYTKDCSVLLKYPEAKADTEYTVIEGVRVIEQSAFFKNENLQRINLLEGLEEIKRNAFSLCKGLKGIEIPSSVTTLGDSAFSSCLSLESIIIHNPEIIIDGYYQFDGCKNVTYAKIPASVMRLIPAEELTFAQITSGTISDGEFAEFDKLEELIVDSGVSKIGARAFYSCDNLQKAQINSPVIGTSAFSGCVSLTEIILGDTVVSIGDYAFASCRGVESIKIKGSVKEVGLYAFAYCTGIQSIVIEKGVEKIGNNAFTGCANLTKLYYYGEENDLLSLVIGDIGNDYLSNAVVYYYIECQEDLPEEGSYWHYDNDGSIVIWQ
ncbi:MAG: leucine-rich repeat domain-containing protein [Clostridia bacterium]|nr:leucine-rich repeat domain-containing protein [Clostridia bacterium]